MQAFFDVLIFELRYQVRSLTFFGLLLVFFLLHLFAVTSTGINLGDNHLLHMNSPYQLLLTTLIFNLFILLPIIYFVVVSVIRDHDYRTAEFFFTTPVPKSSLFLGRFAGSLLPALLVALVGVLGLVVGPFTPLAEPNKVGPFSLVPFLYTFFVISVPNFFIASCLFFSIAVLTRSTALTVAGVVVFIAADLWLNTNIGRDIGPALALLDPFGGLAFQAEIRYWTVTELNSSIPIGMLPQNRILWTTLSTACLLLSLYYFRNDLNTQGNFLSIKRSRQHSAVMPGQDLSTAVLQKILVQKITPQPNILRKFISQLKMDLVCVLKNPLFYVLTLAAVSAVIGYFRSNVFPIMALPIHPLTSNMIEVFRYQLVMYVMLIAIYYSGILVHRERDARINQIVGALPVADGVMVTSKTLALCTVVVVFLVVAMSTSIALQAAAGYTNFEIGIYLQSLFIYNGAYYFMLCILAVFIQVLASNKWFGMLLTLVCFVVLTIVPVLGFEHPLTNFSLPPVTYSDMNGFGHFAIQIYSLILYWGALCGIILILGHLLFLRGSETVWHNRIKDARTRMSGCIATLTGILLVIFIGTGCWIFYQTNIRNLYLDSDDLLQRQADYEKAFGDYENAPTPSFVHVDFSLDLVPEQRSFTSKGRATLRNNKAVTITEFVLSTKPGLTLDSLEVESASLSKFDKATGFYLFALKAPLQPGESVTLSWQSQQQHHLFESGVVDTDLVGNGTYITNFDFMPVPGFNKRMLIEDNTVRAKFGLAPILRTAALGDPEYLDEITGGSGIDSRATMHAIISTAPDQTAVTPGKLQRQWLENDRRYFEYIVEQPVWPMFSINSARYAVASREWNGIEMAIYYHPQHAYNVEAMLDTAVLAMDFFNRTWGEYQFPWFRVVEYARYKRAANPFAGTIAYSEATGFIYDLSSIGIDQPTVHELAHMWWGHRIIGANMQGRQFLNEGMSEYARLQFLGEHFGNYLVRRELRDLNVKYLESRKGENVAELPLMYTEDQPNLSYGKGPLVMYALTEILGQHIVNRAIGNFLDKFALTAAPFPTSLDFVNEIRYVAAPEHQDLITDLFERIIIYDIDLRSATMKEVNGIFAITLEVYGNKFEADAQGGETEVNLDTEFKISLFEDASVIENEAFDQPLYSQKHRLHSGLNTIKISLPERPGFASVDPMRAMIDRNLENNEKELELVH